MSYSFNVKAATKGEAGKAVAEKLGEVVANQPIHEADRQVAQDAAEGVLNALRDDPDQGISITVSGSCWGGDDGLANVSLNISASLSARVAD